MDTYKTAAAQGFTLLASQYKTCDFSGNFWFAGNAFHACLDYMINSGTTDIEPKIVPAAYAIYQTLYNAGDWWHDDYGWWGNAFVVALDNRGALGYGDPSYNALFDGMATAADYCWQQMEANWGKLPYGSKDAQDHAAGQADITGGTYNIFPNPNPQPMQGRNSVTNEGYWLLSLGLAARNPLNQQYAQAAHDEQAWFQFWLKRQPGILNANGLVLERPLGNAAVPAWYWSGDQGLLMRALYASNADPKQALAIAFATIDKMKDPRGILHENLDFQDKLTGFVADYATGKGIFMRGLTQVNVGPVRPFDDFITRNAAAVWCSRVKQSGTYAINQFMFNWDLAPGYEPDFLLGTNQGLCNLIMQAAGQGALNAAVLIAPGSPITC